MPYGLRLRTWSQSLGSAFDWFVPDESMPEAPNPRGHKIFRDIIETPSGNTFLYDKGKIKFWRLTFRDIKTLDKERFEHVAHGWIGSKQITMVYFGTSVIGTVESPGSMSTAGQLWGTGYITLLSEPEEVDMDFWNVELSITQFGSSQSFS